jgi:hypothetical protein
VGASRDSAGLSSLSVPGSCRHSARPSDHCGSAPVCNPRPPAMRLNRSTGTPHALSPGRRKRGSASRVGPGLALGSPVPRRAPRQLPSGPQVPNSLSAPWPSAARTTHDACTFAGTTNNTSSEPRPARAARQSSRAARNQGMKQVRILANLGHGLLSLRVLPVPHSHCLGPWGHGRQANWRSAGHSPLLTTTGRSGWTFELAQIMGPLDGTLAR